MIKFNRIGNKLGLAGAVGVLLSIGLVANQMMTASTVAGASSTGQRSREDGGAGEGPAGAGEFFGEIAPENWAK